MKKATSSVTALMGRIFKKLNDPYQLTVVNKASMEESVSIALTKKSVYIFFASLFISIFILFSLIIFYTPLKYYIPGNHNNADRKELLRLQQLADSLIKMNALRESYVFNLLNVVNGSFDDKRDTTLLNESEIKAAEANNEKQIDKASRYDYLKNQKIDSNIVNKKDSILHIKNQ